MPGRIIRLKLTYPQRARCFYGLSSYQHGSHYRALSTVPQIPSHLPEIDIGEFRQRAFIPEQPILILGDITTGAESLALLDARLGGLGIPAAQKWFSSNNKADLEGCVAREPREPVFQCQAYLDAFEDCLLPYELITHTDSDAIHATGDLSKREGTRLELEPPPTTTLAFRRFNAPLSLFLQACRSTPRLERLYIAQAQIADLPKQLQDDLPTPKVVREAGKGDVYDANIWMGLPPTYTPLHKDPNPNLFVQLASTKVVRLFPPRAGSQMFWEVQQRIGQQSSATFRGDEMMEGAERAALEEAVWGSNTREDGLGAIVRPGDALFIPKGWWHSIKSIGTGITASVNWWFR